METLKFNGNFRDLKHDGWRFHKLFASNYKAYIKATDPKDNPGETCIIWVAKGYVCFPNLFEESSAALVRFLLKNKNIKFPKWSPMLGGNDDSPKGYAPITLVYENDKFRFAVDSDDSMSLWRDGHKPSDQEIDYWQSKQKHKRKFVLCSTFQKQVLKWHKEKFFIFQNIS